MLNTAKTSIIYIVSFVLVYAAAFAAAVFVYHLSAADLGIVTVCVGIGFSAMALLLTRLVPPGPEGRRTFSNEMWIVLALIAWAILYITFGSTFINNLQPKSWQENARVQFFVITIKKLVIFVLIPYLLYNAAGFSMRDIVPAVSIRDTFRSKKLLILTVISAGILLFEYFLSGGAAPLREGKYTTTQLLIGLPLTFAWLLVDVGLVEEFFFRAVLQSRLAALLKSEWGGILLSGLIFGLAHVPGLYLRGASSEGITEQLPLGFWLCYCIVNMSAAGIFLGIIWSRTRNLLLVMVLHAAVDLLPNLGDLIHTWKL